MDQGKLRARLANWGCWLTHEADIGPKDATCISIESRYLPEAGDVWDEEREPCKPIPDVPDAEHMQKLISRLDWLEQHCLALHWGGIPSVFRHKRISDHVMHKMLENAEIMLRDMLIKKA